MKRKLLFIDTETGGVDSNFHSMLSIGLVVWSDGKIIDQKEILVNDEVLNISPQAIQLNKIDIEEHKKVALVGFDVIKEMKEFIDKYFPKEIITLAGHNVGFDVNFIRNFCHKYKFDYSGRFSHRSIDTSSILQYLFDSGKLKKNIVSSDDAFEFFKIKIAKRHSALSDALNAAELYNKLIKFI